MTSRESDIRVSANATDPCPAGVTGVSLDTCSTITNASRSDISDRIYGAPVTYTVQDETLPPALQTSLDNCVDGTCDYVSYDFDTGTSTQHDDLPYVIDTRRTTVENSAVFLKKKEVQIYSVTGDGTTVTVTTTTPHNFEIGGIVTLSVTPFSGEFTIKSIPSPSSFTYESSKQTVCPSGSVISNGKCCPTGTVMSNGECCPTDTVRSASGICSKNETYDTCRDGSSFLRDFCVLKSSYVCPAFSGRIGYCINDTVQEDNVRLLIGASTEPCNSAVSFYPCYPKAPISTPSCKAVGAEGSYTRTRVSETSTACTDTLTVSSVIPTDFISPIILPQNSIVIYSPQPVTTFVAPPGYTYLSTAIGGTQITDKQQTSGASQTSCAQVCDDDSTCQGFNFSSLDETCELFSTIDATSNVATSKVSFHKGKLLDSLPFIPEYSIERAGRNCSNMTKCNEAITNLMNTIDLHTAELDHFKTTNLRACMYCPPRSLSYEPISIPTVDGLPNFVNGYRIQNEYGYSSSAATKSAALDYLLYKDIGGNSLSLSVRNNDTTVYNLQPINQQGSVLFRFSFGVPYQTYLNPRSSNYNVALVSPLTNNSSEYVALYINSNPLTYDISYMAFGSGDPYSVTFRQNIFKMVPISTINNGYYIQATEYIKPYGTFNPGTYQYNFDGIELKIKYAKYDGTNVVISEDFPPMENEWYLKSEFVFILRSSCPAGQYLSGGACTPCTAGSYCPANTVTPIGCPAGTYSSATSATSSSTCQTCLRFNYCPTGSATPTPCANNTENLNTGGTSQSSCQTCPSGTTSGLGQACCPTGYTFANGQCSGTVSCPSGFTYDSTLRTCVNNAQPNPVCPAGSTMGPSGLLCATSPVCPAGTSLTNTGGTITVEYCISTTTPTPMCNQGTLQWIPAPLNRWSCIAKSSVQCPANYSSFSFDQTLGSIICIKERHAVPCTINDIFMSVGYGDGYCRTIEEETSPFVCPTGYIPDPRLDNNGQQQFIARGQCIIDYGIPFCSTGTEAQMTSGLNCVAPMTCPAGTYLGSSWDSTTKCISLPTCPAGSTLDYNTGKCVVSLCPAGYTQSGTTCSKYMCPVGYTGPGDCAQCETGYRWNGTKCEPCLNGGTGGGAASGSARACTCTGSYTGDRCEICPPGFGQSGSSCNACNTNGTQNSSVGGICVCKTGYTGITCGSCAPNYMKYGNECIQCLNGGTSTNGSVCSCPAGFSGRTCSDCAAGYTGTTCQTCALSYTWDGTACVPCSSGSTSGGAASGGARSCTCATGYTGALCDTCASTHHWNGRACTSCYNSGTSGGAASGAARMCACLAAYTGDRCMLCASTHTWNGSACVACPSYGTGGGAAFGTARACACGSAYSGITCDTCVLNAVWNGSACHLCQNGGTATSGPASGANRSCTCPTGYTGFKCDQCVANYVWNGTSCVPCQNGGTAASGPASGLARACTCPSSAYGGDQCELCSMSYSWNGSSCQFCGAYTSLGTGGPASGPAKPCDCSVTAYDRTPGSFTCDLCREGFTYITYGFGDSRSGCYACLNGGTAAKGPASGGVRGCSCPSGKYGFTCCPAGTYGPSCTPCPFGQYSTGSELLGCSMCPAGTYNGYRGQTSSTACILCPAGQVSQAGSPYCTACPVGTYTLTAYPGEVSCVQCPANTYNPNTGQTVSCTACPAGTQFNGTGGTSSTVCTACPIGYYSDTAGQGCTACPANTYNVSTGQTSCTNCSTGKQFNGSGATSSTACTACPNNTYNDVEGQACKGCPVGKEYTGTGATSSTACTACPNNTYNDVAGQACKGCSAGTQYIGTGATASTACTACPNNTYNNVAGQACKGCSAGTYYTGTGATTCTACPADTGTTPVYSSLCTLSSCTATDVNGIASIISSVCRLTCKTDFQKKSTGTCVSCPSTYSITSDVCTGNPSCTIGSFSTSRYRCESSSTSNFTCPNGTSWNSLTSRCESTKSCTGITGIGAVFYDNSLAKCISNAVLSQCPSGYSYTSYNASTNSGTCTANATYGTLSCVSRNYTFYSTGPLGNGGAAGKCCTTQACTTTETPGCFTFGGFVPVFVNSYYGWQCVKAGGTTTTVSNWCPSGSTFRANGQCIYDYGAPSCPSQTSESGTLCIANPTCTSTGTWDTVAKVCYYAAGACPYSGFTQNTTTKICSKTV